MSGKDVSDKLPRRAFLKGAGVAGAAAGAAVVLSSDKTEAAVPEGESTDGYRETDHVKTYYDLARF